MKKIHQQITLSDIQNVSQYDSSDIFWKMSKVLICQASAIGYVSINTMHIVPEYLHGTLRNFMSW